MNILKDTIEDNDKFCFVFKKAKIYSIPSFGAVTNMGRIFWWESNKLCSSLNIEVKSMKPMAFDLVFTSREAAWSMVMQNCRSKKRKVTYRFWLIVASLFVFFNFFANHDNFLKF